MIGGGVAIYIQNSCAVAYAERLYNTYKELHLWIYPFLGNSKRIFGRSILVFTWQWHSRTKPHAISVIIKVIHYRRIRRLVLRHFWRDTDVKRCMVFHARPKVLPNNAVASSSSHMPNKQCSWNWRYFFRISHPYRVTDHVKNLMGSSQCHFRSSYQISWKSIH